MYFRRIDDFSALVREPAAAALTRRTFLQFTTMAGAGLTLGAFLPGAAGECRGCEGGWPRPPRRSRRLSCASAPDNTVTLICKHVEAGQGVWTGLSAVLAEELDASWSQMRAEGAPAKVPTYGNLAFDPRGQRAGHGRFHFDGELVAAASRSGRDGASHARGRPPRSVGPCRHQRSRFREGLVSHSSGKRATFGELASDAAKQPVPKDVKFKDPSRVQAHRSRQVAAPRQSREVHRHAAVRHRCVAAGDDDGGRAPPAEVRCEGALDRFGGREGGAGRCGCRADSAWRGGGRSRYVGARRKVARR